MTEAEGDHSHRIAHIDLDTGMEGIRTVFCFVDDHIHSQISMVYISINAFQGFCNRFLGPLVNIFSYPTFDRCSQIFLTSQYISGVGTFFFRTEDGESFIGDMAFPIGIKLHR